METLLWAVVILGGMYNAVGMIELVFDWWYRRVQCTTTAWFPEPEPTGR